MGQYFWYCIRKSLKQNISLLLVVAMLFGAVPQVGATQMTALVAGETAGAEELTFAQELTEMALLADIHDAMMANPDAVQALTGEESAAIRNHVQEVYNAIEDPDENEMEYYELIMGTLEIVGQEVNQPLAEPEPTPLTSAGGSLAAGSYILNEDIKLNEAISITKGEQNAVIIDLNGHVLEGPGDGTVIKNNGYLTIKDSRPEAGGRWFLVKEDGPWEMVTLEAGADTTGYKLIKGGIITGGRDKTKASSSSGGGAIKMGANDTAKSYRLYLQGGTLVGNSSTRAGGAVYGGTIYMSGGTVTGNYADLFGGGLSLSGSLHLSDGLIELNNTSATSSYNTCGEGANYDNANVIIGFQSQFEMSGGIIRGNISTVRDTGGVAPNFDIKDGLIEGNFRLLNRLTATFSGGELCGYVYMNSGTCIVEDDAWIHNGERNDGGSVCIRNGQFQMTGGVIENGHAYKTGGAIHIDQGTCTISGGMIQNCTAVESGGAIYLGDGGTFSMSGGSITGCNATADGGAVYLGGGTMTLAGGSIANNTAQNNGGAVYLGGGTLTVSGGSINGNKAITGNGGGAYVNGGNVEVYGVAGITGNTAAKNGGGVAVNNGNFTMSGGKVDDNQAIAGNGGGIYVSTSDTDVKVDVLSGSVSQNTAGTSGGALAVAGPEGSDTAITVTVGVNKDHFDDNGELKNNLAHGEHGSVTCPVINENNSQASGGAVYVTGSKNARLHMYCLTERDNKVGTGDTLSDFMMVEGGTVEITTENSNPTVEGQSGKLGHTVIQGTIYVIGGDVDIWGTMTNPDIADVITVDIKKESDAFDDHRVNGSGSDVVKYYKLLYFENFTDPATQLTTGQYKEFRIEHGQYEKIKDVLYSHTGYKIQGWNTQPDRSDTEFASNRWEDGQPYYVNGWYRCNEEYLFDDTRRADDGAARGDLTLYAIWEPVGYLILFDANVAEGEVYSGEMEALAMEYDVEKNLTANAFGRKGYYFQNWNTQSDGTGTSYVDQAAVKNLSTEVGKPVTLYAQWEKCDHNPETHQYTYTAKDGVLIGNCECDGCTVTATLTAENTVYDMQDHPAKLDVTVSGVNVEAVVAPDFSVTYQKAGTDNNYGDMPEGITVPKNAGKYKASIAAGEVAASAEYVIEKAEQPAPEKPTYEPNISENNSTLKLNHVNEAELKTKDLQGYDCVREYMVAYDDGTGKMVETEWRRATESEDAPSFEMSIALTNYYVYARYSEGTNYLASDATRADTEYFFVGNVRIVVTGGMGVVYDVKKSSGEGENTTGVQLVLTVQDGYYFPIGYAVTKENHCTVKIDNSSTNTLVIATNAESNEKRKIYDLSSIPSDCEITINLPDAVPLPTVTGYVTEGQVFGSFTDTEASISQDSAYTARFEVKHFDAKVYAGTFTFNENLPENTKLILLKKSGEKVTYYRYTGSGNSIVLTEFIQMGTRQLKFALGESEQNVALQLIVNVDGKVLSGNSQKTALVLTPNDQPGASEVVCEVKTTLCDPAKFGLTAKENKICLSYTPSTGTASVLDGRENALVLYETEPGKALPDDAQLQYTFGGSHYVCSANPEGKFVIPLGSLNENPQEISLELVTQMEPGSYPLTVDWYVANSRAETSPMNGDKKASDKITVSAAKADVSLKVSAPKHLYDKNETLTATVNVENIAGYTVKLEVQKKEHEVYQSRGQMVTVTGNGTVTFKLSDVPGSYRLYLYAYTGYERVETAFYFIVN